MSIFKNFVRGFFEGFWDQTDELADFDAVDFDNDDFDT